MQKKEPEIIDLVDANDQVIKQIQRDDSINNIEVHGGYIRVVDCYIMNSMGEIWVPRRTAYKRIAPNGYDFSIGEHMQSGETYKDAIIRGFQEEVGFTPDKDKLEFLGVSKPREDGDMFQGFYIYHSEVAPELNPQDFVEAIWIKPDELLRKIESGENAKSNIVPTVRKFLLAKS